jgi:PPOX class probable F420-dependent enzyme
MELSDALEFARTTRDCVLTTIRSNGRPQLSNVWQQVDETGIINMSMTADRAKFVNLEREPWAAIHFTRPDFFAYAVIEADVELSSIATRSDDATVGALVAHYQRIVGEHRDWDQFRRTQVDERRVLARFTPTRAYGILPR